MKKRVLLIAALMCATPIAVEAADHSHHQALPGALVEEMKVLDGVFREVVSAVALGDGHRVHKALETMHGRMEKTQEALHKGEVTLRKNASKASEFEKMDKDFHKDLEVLAKAAHKGDRKGMALVTGKLLNGCVACHEKFRP